MVVLTFCYGIYLSVRGVLPVLYHLGLALSKRRVAIFAESDDFNNLKNILVDSKLFKSENVLQIDRKSIGKAGEESLLLLHWGSFKESLNEVLKLKRDATALVVYAPPEDGRVGNDAMKKLSEHRNVIVVNFRGRLINDVLVCMITSRWTK